MDVYSVEGMPRSIGNASSARVIQTAQGMVLVTFIRSAQADNRDQMLSKALTKPNSSRFAPWMEKVSGPHIDKGRGNLLSSSHSSFSLSTSSTHMYAFPSSESIFDAILVMKRHRQLRISDIRFLASASALSITALFANLWPPTRTYQVRVP